MSPKLGTGLPQYSQSRKRRTFSRATSSRYCTRRGQRRQSTISVWADNLAILNNDRQASRECEHLSGLRVYTTDRGSELLDDLIARHADKQLLVVGVADDSNRRRARPNPDDLSWGLRLDNDGAVRDDRSIRNHDDVRCSVSTVSATETGIAVTR